MDFTIFSNSITGTRKYSYRTKKNEMEEKMKGVATLRKRRIMGFLPLTSMCSRKKGKEVDD